MKMKALRPAVMYITALIVILSFVFWVGALFVGYVLDDWGAPAASERSVPPPLTY